MRRRDQQEARDSVRMHSYLIRLKRKKIICLVCISVKPPSDITMYRIILFLAFVFSLSEGLRIRRGDCSSGSNCISPLPIDSSPYNPGTIETSTDANGILSVQAVPGDMPMNTLPDTDRADSDYARKFTIRSPSIIQPDPAPPLIVCQVGNCPTTTTPNPVA